MPTGKSLVNLRRTIVVHTKLAGHVVRVEAARSSAHGLQILTMGRVAARLAGGFIQPIDHEVLEDAVKAALGSTHLGELEGIKQLPGMVRAAVNTLNKVWNAGIDLAPRSAHPRLKSLALLEQEVLSRLPRAMKRPSELVALARSRIKHAAAVLGPVEVHGHSEMSPCWRPLLESLAEVVPVDWIAGPLHVPEWLQTLKIRVRRGEPQGAAVTLFSCANPQHEVIEAFRWVRSLLANGTAKPEEIALAAASPSELDDHVVALTRESNLPIHFVHGVKALTRREGQAAAALAEVLLKGLSQERIRRLFALLGDASRALNGLPSDWARVLPRDAPLATLPRWEQALAGTEAADWPEDADRSNMVLDVLRLVAKGPDAATECGARLLPKSAWELWRRALRDGPAQALPVTLAGLRVHDGLEPAANVVWTSAVSLASAPRRFAWLIGLNAGRWPRRITEDPLIPDHLIPIEELDPLPISEADRRDFATIRATTARMVAVSYSRRDVEGRLLGRSPLIGSLEENYLGRGRTPEHAASHSDRLLARPREFEQLPMATSALRCWRDWVRPAVTAHDGLVGREHPRIAKMLAEPLSATSLKLVLRDPIRYVWKYALGWREPEEAEEPLSLDAASFGGLVHDVLRRAVDALEDGDGLARATPGQIQQAIGWAVDELATSWETEQPVPPHVIARLPTCTKGSAVAFVFVWAVGSVSVATLPPSVVNIPT
jgi:PD-(D/E)XK nuclease superfamily protein